MEEHKEFFQINFYTFSIRQAIPFHSRTDTFDIYSIKLKGTRWPNIANLLQFVFIVYKIL